MASWCVKFSRWGSPGLSPTSSEPGASGSFFPSTLEKIACLFYYLFVYFQCLHRPQCYPSLQLNDPFNNHDKNPLRATTDESNPPGPLQPDFFSYLICFCGIQKPYVEVHKKYKYAGKWVITKQALLDIFSHFCGFLSSFLFLCNVFWWKKFLTLIQSNMINLSLYALIKNLF